MATYNTYANGHSTVVDAMAAASAPMRTTFEATFDATKRNLAAGDVVELIRVPAGTYVEAVFVEVVRGEAGQTVNVGDGADPDGYVVAAAAATDGAMAVGGGALAGGKLYTAADTIDIEVPALMAYTSLAVRVVVAATLVG